MNEFNFRVANAAPRASVFEIGQNVGDTKTTYIYSYKTKYINGKSTGQKTNVDWDMESSIPSWVSVKYAFEGNDCKVTFTTLQENTGSSARTHTLVFKQRESGQTISFPISQPTNFTYTYFLNVFPLIATIGANIGNTTTIRGQSYMTRSDGEVIAKLLSVGATPSWANKVTVKDGSIGAPNSNWYQIIVEVTAANSSSSERSETLLVTCGDQRREVTIWQKAVDIPMYVEIWGRYDKNSTTTYKDLPYILNYNGQYVTSGTLPASRDEYLLIPVTKVPWSDNGSSTEPTAIFELYLKGSQLVPYSDFYFNMSLYDAQGLFYGCEREYSQAINYKIDTVDPSDWTPSGSNSHGSITVKKGNLSPLDFSGGLIELILGNKINGYVKRVMLRIRIN